jgi:uncharacterized protein YciI
MLFVVIGTDGPEAPTRRREHLEAHLDWVRGAMERIRVAGPLRATPGGEPCMSLYVLDAVDEADARALLATDPYFKAGVWRTVDFRAFHAAAGTWVGGAAWDRSDA